MPDLDQRPADRDRFRIWDIGGLLFLISMLTMTAVGLLHLKTNTEDVLQWLPDTSDARADYDFFKQHFVSDDFVILTWDGCTTDDPRLREFSAQLRQRDDRGLISEVTSGYDVTLQLGERLNLTREAIVQRMRGVFFGLRDPDLTCVLAELSHEGTKHRSDVMQLIDDSIAATDHLDRQQVALAGYPYIATYIDQQLAQSYRQLMIPSMILATLIALFCLKDWRLNVIVFLTATGASSASVALAPLCGFRLGGLMSIIPALTFVLATSGSIHLIRYSLDVIGDPNRLLAIGWRPCVISTATTAVGMLSLVRSEFPAIREFGLFCAAGVGFALAFQLVIVPWLLYRFGQSGLRHLAQLSQRSRFWIWLGDRIDQYRWPVTLLFVSLIVVGGAGLFRLQAEVEVEKLFRPDAPIIQSLEDMESRLAPMDQTEVLLVFDDVSQSEVYQRLAYTRAVQNAIKQVDGVEVAFSLSNFLPTEPVIRRPRDAIRRSAFHDQLQRERERLANGGLLAIDHQQDREIWRVSVRFPFTRQVDFERIKGEVEQAAESVRQRWVEYQQQQAANEDSQRVAEPTMQPPEMKYTGHTYLFHHAQRKLLRDLFQNFLLAFVIIAPLLVVVLRSWKIGLIAMLPNVFPTIVVFGGLGWASYPIDLALAMTACVALGIAVDDTTHFLIRFRDHGGKLNNVIQPIHRTLEQCGPAMTHTTLIASVSLLTYYFSDMLVVSRFSWAISLLLVVALLADVLMLPAVLLLLGRAQAPDVPDGRRETID